MKICFFSLYAYPLFNLNSDGPFGGAEVRCSFIAKALAQIPGFEVSIIVFDEGQPDNEIIDNVRIVRWGGWPPSQIPTSRERVMWIAKHLLTRLFLPRPLMIEWYKVHWRQLRTFQKVDADVFCAFGVSNVVAELSAYCKERQKKLILFATSDDNFSEAFYDGSREKDVYDTWGFLGYHAIENASAIVVQTQDQATLCLDEFDKAAEIIKNPIHLLKKHTKNAVIDEPYVLWIGKSDRVKQPRPVIALAKKHPDVPFVLLMNKSSPTLFAKIVETAPENVRIIERLDFDEAEKLFLGASVLLNTSRFEGFPNTFLQAGKYGVPVLSLNVDPDGILSKENCGICAQGKDEELSDGLMKFLNDKNFHASCGHNLSKYIQDNNDLDKNIKSLVEIISRVNEAA